MKIAIATLLAAAGTTAAFTTVPSTPPSATLLRMAESSITEETNISEEPPMPEDPLPQMSAALPFMERPAALTGSMAGDVGFDPLGFAKSKEDLMNYREAEIKHGRLAMLAAAGWPLSEVFDKKIAGVLDLPAVVDSADRAPSLFNGGLGKVSPVYWVACLAAAAAIDVYGISKSKSGNPEYFPGNLGFDPLGLYPKDEEGQMRMQLAEIKHGRLGMIAITAFAVQEFVSKTGVVDETPLFFKPLPEVLMEYTNSGYIN